LKKVVTGLLKGNDSDGGGHFFIEGTLPVRDKDKSILKTKKSRFGTFMNQRQQQIFPAVTRS